MILLVDRKRSKMFTLVNGLVMKNEEFKFSDTPRKVRHGDDTWDAQDKIYRHIEDHVHRHLASIAESATIFAKQNHVSGIIIGGHKPLFSKIVNHLKYPLNKKVKGTFVTELKAPFDEIVKRAIDKISKLEIDEEIKRYEKSLANNS